MEYACDEITWTPGAAKLRDVPTRQELLDQRGADGWRLLNTDSWGNKDGGHTSLLWWERPTR
ncbi:hypothetical protein GCM10028814_20690 [Angustibacter aerolatus]